MSGVKRLRYDHVPSVVLAAERDARDLSRASRELKSLQREYESIVSLAKAERAEIKEWEENELKRVTELAEPYYQTWASMMAYQRVSRVATRHGNISVNPGLTIEVTDDQEFIAALTPQLKEQLTVTKVTVDGKALRVAVSKMRKQLTVNLDADLRVSDDGRLLMLGEALPVTITETSSMTFTAPGFDQPEPIEEHADETEDPE